MTDKAVNDRLELLGVNFDDLHPILNKNSHYRLQLQNDQLALYHDIEKYHIVVDFTSKKLQFRSRSHINAELVNKAILGKKKQATSVLDCTAGFGKDAYLMSLTGSKISACESNLLMYALLKDGFNRAHIDHIILNHMDAIHAIEQTDCEVIYLDPMYPESKKSAKNNKDMTFLQRFVGHQQNMAENLFAKARQSSAQKIVIKRPIKSDHVFNQKPTSQITGKAVRFDIYVN